MKSRNAALKGKIKTLLIMPERSWGIFIIVYHIIVLLLLCISNIRGCLKPCIVIFQTKRGLCLQRRVCSEFLNHISLTLPC